MQKGERRQEFVLTGAQREEFIGELSEPCKTLARFLIDTGLGVGECCALTWDRVLMDGDTGYFFVCRGKTGERNATSGWRQTHRLPWRGRRASPRSQYMFVRFRGRGQIALVSGSPIAPRPI